MAYFPIINKFNFPSEMIYFEETRNDLYITLQGGEFSNDNVEVVVEVRLEDGERVQVLFITFQLLKECISLGYSSIPQSEFRFFFLF